MIKINALSQRPVSQCISFNLYLWPGDQMPKNKVTPLTGITLSKIGPLLIFYFHSAKKSHTFDGTHLS